MLDTGGIDTPGTVIAFDLATGSRRWTAAVAGSSEQGEGGIVDGDRIVVVDGLGTVTALDRTTGRRRWSHDLPMPVFHGRPIAIGDALVLRTISGEIHVLDRRTGRHQGVFRVDGVGVGLGGGPAGLVFARSQVTHPQVVGLPPAMLTMRTPDRTPPVLVPTPAGAPARARPPAEVGETGPDYTARPTRDAGSPVLGISHARHPKVAPVLRWCRSGGGINPREGTSAWLSSP